MTDEKRDGDAPRVLARRIMFERGRRLGSDVFPPGWPTRHVYTAREGFFGSNDGLVEVSLFESTDGTKNGGVVLRLESDTLEDFVPYVKLTERGVELHLAGEWEAEAYLRALVQVLQKRPPRVQLEISEPAASDQA